MQSVDAPVSKALVLVCEKCGKRLDSPDENPSRQLVSKLKKLAKKQFGRGEVRAVTSSCMDICPEDAVSVAITTLSGPHSSTRFFVVEPDDIEATSHRILKEIR